MPGLRGKQFRIDTTTWTVRDWRRAHIWNIVFLVGWIAFFVYALGNLLYDRNWLMFAPTAVISIIGGIPQLAWFMRGSHSLKVDRNS